MAVTDPGTVADQLAGLDELEQDHGADDRVARGWGAVWPKVLAVAIAIGLWQLVVLTGWKPRYVLPGPTDVLPRLTEELTKANTWTAVGNTARRAVVGLGLAIVIGTVIGLGVTRSKVLRSAVGSLITGLQTMPSIAWFPLALTLFKRSEGAIFFVCVLGAAPAIANGIISGVDHIPPLWLRAGRVMGARGFDKYRHVIVPAALPSFVSGLKQGWAFLWRSLMAGELLVIIANKPSIGSRLQFEYEFSDYEGMLAWMLIILIIGILVDAMAFGRLERTLRERRGLVIED
jgi:NitT/TauT family transport system permease protein